MKPLWVAALAGLGLLSAAADARAADQGLPANLLSGNFVWTCSTPLVAPANRPEDPCHSVKDPTLVQHNGRWHLFTTIRSVKRTHQIEYLSFADWAEADKAQRHVLRLSDGYFCAPQVFWFRPHRKWYLICQVAEPSRKPALQPAFSTTTHISDPASWSKPELLYAQHPANVKAWIDFWVICDEAKAHLFFTSNNGLMWRAETKLADFPRGWTQPQVVLRGDIFEASHTYRLKGLDKYLTLVEAQDGRRRYYKAYLADRLDGEWMPLANTREKPFAGRANVRDSGPHWADSISHGELLRAGCDERLEVDPTRLRFLFQCVLDEQMAGKKYGEIPWRLGILEAQK
ncbi:MAG: glycoside hydrolase [Verrucomicrobia bacterium]|nr:glycoside hydrolase [Verrucomicrobiota bacterium]